MSQPDLFRAPRKPWKAGRMIGAKAPLKPRHIRAIRQQLKSIGAVRDLAMFNIALDARLRGCDLVRLRVSDVAQAGSVRHRSTVIQQKTGRPVPLEITEPARDALAHWLETRGQRADDWLFPSRTRAGAHIGTRQYARLVDRWVQMIDLNPGAYGTHSLRRTKVALIYKKTGNVRACQLLLGHGSWRAPCATLASRWMTPSKSRSRSTSERSRFTPALCGSATPGWPPYGRLASDVPLLNRGSAAWPT